MTILYFDCFSGASGDMVLGALVDAGVPLSDLREALGSLTVSQGDVWTERVVRAGLGATKFHVRGETVGASHAHSHHHEAESARHDTHPHGHTAHAHGPGPSHRHEAPSHSHAHSHRTLVEIFGLVDSSALSSKAKQRTKELFTRLGEVEADIHGTSLDKVHLHEVGALDSIIDIAGSVFALERLGIDRVVASSLNVGSGTVESAHGLYPVPAPATLRLLRGAPIYSGHQHAELVTPTGALLITAYADEFGAIPPMRVDRIGYGAGTRDFPHAPNVLRVLIGQSDNTGPSRSVSVIEAEIDDMNPQLFGVLMDTLLAQGALDVFYTPIQMKKNRPGTLLTVIASPDLREQLTATVFRETTTIGVRFREAARECLDRETETVQTGLGPVRIKVASRRGVMLNAAPEFDDCVRLAEAHKVPTKDVQALAMKAYLEAAKRGL